MDFVFHLEVVNLQIYTGDNFTIDFSYWLHIGNLMNAYNSSNSVNYI